MKTLAHLVCFLCLAVAVSAATPVRFYATAVAAGTTTTETAISLTRSRNVSATSAAVSWLVPAGKQYKVINIIVSSIGNAVATAQSTVFNFRFNSAGAVTTTSTPVLVAIRTATPATSGAIDRVSLCLPDGSFTIAGDGALQIGVTAAATYTTNAPTWDVCIIAVEI